MTEKTYNLADICKAAIFQLDNFCEVNGLRNLVKPELVCITCSSKEVYEARKAYYEFDNRFIYQAPVSNRRIALIGLKESLRTSVGEIGLLEIVDQKPDNSQTDRLTHVGIVPQGIPYEEIIIKLKENGANLEDRSRPDGYTACDVVLPTTFRIRIQKESLLGRVKREEMV